MFRAAFALALCAPLAIAAPAHAADVATLGCVEQGMDKNARTLLLTDLETNLKNSGQAQSYRPETVQAIQAVALACKTKHGWTTEAAQAAILYTMPKIGWPLADRMGRAGGLNPDALAKRFRALPENERNDAINDEVLGKLARGSLAAGEINANNAALGGALYGLLALREKALADFKAN
ncbi:MAG: hypothetical protein V4574_11690 [Pseudomonadota bacterium]